MNNFEKEGVAQLDYADEIESLDYGDEESEEEKIMNLENPLSIINPDADLDAILAARSIGDAIQILCPKIPGLPSKVRGKYKKRRMMTLDAKTQMMKDQNKENARRTRRRKKLYDIFLARVIAALEDLLNPPDDSDNHGLSTFSSNSTNLSNKISRNSLHSNDGSLYETNYKSVFQPHISIINEESENFFKTLRIDYLSKYLMMRVSAQASTEPWLTVCSPTIFNSMPIPVYRFGQVQSKKPNREHLGRCELHGINALIEDTESQINFIISLLHSRGKEAYGWTIEAELHPETSILGGNKDTLCMWYDYQVYEVPSTSGTEKFTKASWTKLLRISAKTNVKYGLDNRISYIFDEFDVFHILRQCEAVANLPNSEFHRGRPAISTKDTIATNPKVNALLPSHMEHGKTECLDVDRDNTKIIPENIPLYNHETKDSNVHPSHEHAGQSNPYRGTDDTKFGRDFYGENRLYEQDYRPPPHYYPMAVNPTSRYSPPYPDHGQYNYTGYNQSPESYQFHGDVNVNTHFPTPGRCGYPNVGRMYQDNSEAMQAMMDPTVTRNSSLYPENFYRSSSKSAGSQDNYYHHPREVDRMFDRDLEKRYNNFHDDNNNYKRFPVTSHEQDGPFSNDPNDDYNSYDQRKYRYFSKNDNYYTSETLPNYPQGMNSSQAPCPPSDESLSYRRSRNDNLEREYYQSDRSMSGRTENIRYGNKSSLEDNCLQAEPQHSPKSNSSEQTLYRSFVKILKYD